LMANSYWSESFRCEKINGAVKEIIILRCASAVMPAGFLNDLPVIED